MINHNKVNRYQHCSKCGQRLYRFATPKKTMLICRNINHKDCWIELRRRTAIEKMIDTLDITKKVSGA